MNRGDHLIFLTINIVLIGFSLFMLSLIAQILYEMSSVNKGGDLVIGLLLGSLLLANIFWACKEIRRHFKAAFLRKSG